MNKNEEKALEDINNYGCHVLNVLEGEQEPRFSYSIGLNKLQSKPDLIIVGLKHDLAHGLINDFHKRISDGEEFKENKYYKDFLEGFDVCFVKVSPKHHEDYTGWASWLHKGKDYKYLQLVWPDTQGRWPWDSGISEYYEWAQPILNDKGVLERF